MGTFFLILLLIIVLILGRGVFILSRESPFEFPVRYSTLIKLIQTEYMPDSFPMQEGAHDKVYTWTLRKPCNYKFVFHDKGPVLKVKIVIGILNDYNETLTLHSNGKGLVSESMQIAMFEQIQRRIKVITQEYPKLITPLPYQK